MSSSSPAPLHNVLSMFLIKKIPPKKLLYYAEIHSYASCHCNWMLYVCV